MNFFADWVAARINDGPPSLNHEFVRAAVALAMEFTPAQINAALAIILFRELRASMSEDDAIEQIANLYGMNSERVRAAAINQTWPMATQCAAEIENLTGHKVTAPETSAN